MTYVTVSELRKRYHDCEICLFNFSDQNSMYSDLAFKVVNVNPEAWNVIIKNEDIRTWIYLTGVMILRRINFFRQIKETKEIMKSCDAIFDISGYAISSQWGIRSTERKISEVIFFDSCHIPYFMMPQSFGPFNYTKKKNCLIKRLNSALKTCRCVYAREREGYELLVNEIGLSNVRLSADIVLQSRVINMSGVFKNVVKRKEIRLSTKENVAIIPNMRNFDHGDRKEILHLYDIIIEWLLEHHKNIYLISHSEEDGEACRLIKDKFTDIDGVRLLVDKMDCFAFEDMIGQFDFAVASRYHSVVHSYRNSVPCIVLGWATKYRSLTKLFDQEQYIFDVRTPDSFDGMTDALEKMAENFGEEKKKISDKLVKIQDNNCFDQIDF